MNLRVFACALACVAAPASAHAFLDHANPGAGASLRAAPKTLMLTFSDDLDAEASGVAALRSALGISLPSARVLCARGFGNAAEARRFLAPSTADLHDPFLLADMQMPVKALNAAL